MVSPSAADQFRLSSSWNLRFADREVEKEYAAEVCEGLKQTAGSYLCFPAVLFHFQDAANILLELFGESDFGTEKKKRKK